MSISPTETVIFTPADKSVSKIELTVSEPKAAGTVIYVTDKDTITICENIGVNDLAYKKTTETMRINNHALRIGNYYVVTDNPCDSESKKFFKCSPTPAPRPEKASAMPTKSNNNIKPVPVTERTVFFSEAITASTATDDSMTIYKIEGNKLVKSANVTLSAIRNAHTIKQNAIIPDTSLNNIRQTIDNLYDWVNTNFNITNKSEISAYDKLYNDFFTKVYGIINKEEIEKTNRTFRTKINKYIDKLNTFNKMLVQQKNSMFYKRIATDNVNKLKFVYYEIINNIFNILVLKNNPNIDIDTIINNISKLNISNFVVIYFTQNTSTTTNSNTKYYLIGIDSAINDELGLTDDKYSNIKPVVVSKEKEQTLSGGARKTKKRNQVSNKQSRKTKKQSRNHKK